MLAPLPVSLHSADLEAPRDVFGPVAVVAAYSSPEAEPTRQFNSMSDLTNFSARWARNCLST
jgi:hypothetical protein